jgi:hypothetical protein
VPTCRRRRAGSDLVPIHEVGRDRLQRELRSLDQTFTDPRLCAAIVDRLTFAGNIIETGTVSYRLAHARARRATR